MGHSSGSDSEGSDKEKKHSKHDKHDKHKEDKHKEDKHKEESSGHLSSHHSEIIPGHEQYGGKLKKEDVENLKHRTDISEEEREHRRKVMMAEVAAGVVGTGVLGFAGYQAYQHFSGKGEDTAHVQHKEA
jgi:hypothetical protein